MASKKIQTEFNNKIRKFLLEEVKATEIEQPYPIEGRHQFSVETNFGTYLIFLHTLDKSDLFSVFGRFRNPIYMSTLNKLFGSNSFSGKYNFHVHAADVEGAVEDYKLFLNEILNAKP